MKGCGLLSFLSLLYCPCCLIIGLLAISGGVLIGEVRLSGVRASFIIIYLQTMFQLYKQISF